MSKEKNSKLLKFITISSLPIAYYLSGTNIFNKMFKVDRNYENQDLYEILPDDNTKRQYANYIDDDISWFKLSKTIKLEITSFDGLKLRGTKISNNNSNKIIILVHDINADRYSLLRQAKIFDELGFNILLIDNRGWGMSDGKYTTCGFKESLDLLSWIKSLLDDNKLLEIGLYGLSFGNAAIMMCLGYKLPSNVKFAITDTVFTSVSDILKIKYGSNFFNPVLNLKIKQELGFSLNDLNCVDSIKRNMLPLLIIHAKSDEIFPSSMAKELYDNTNGYKKIHLISNTKHNYNCYDVEFKEYIADFLRKID